MEEKDKYRIIIDMGGENIARILNYKELQTYI